MNRRKFFGMAAGAAVVGPKAAEAAAREIAASQVNRAQAAGAGLGAYLGAPSPMPPAMQAIYDQIGREEQAMYRRHQFRVDGFDPDIASLRLPKATKIRMQVDRDDRDRSTLQVLHDKIAQLRSQIFG